MYMYIYIYIYILYIHTYIQSPPAAPCPARDSPKLFQGSQKFFENQAQHKISQIFQKTKPKILKRSENDSQNQTWCQDMCLAL